jgi:hypothetical protein
VYGWEGLQVRTVMLLYLPLGEGVQVRNVTLRTSTPPPGPPPHPYSPSLQNNLEINSAYKVPYITVYTPPVHKIDTST